MATENHTNAGPQAPASYTPYTAKLYQALSANGYNVGADPAAMQRALTKNPESRQWAFLRAQKIGFEGPDGKPLDDFVSFQKAVAAEGDTTQWTPLPQSKSYGEDAELSSTDAAPAPEPMAQEEIRGVLVSSAKAGQINAKKLADLNRQRYGQDYAGPEQVPLKEKPAEQKAKPAQQATPAPSVSSQGPQAQSIAPQPTPAQNTATRPTATPASPRAAEPQAPASLARAQKPVTPVLKADKKQTRASQRKNAQTVIDTLKAVGFTPNAEDDVLAEALTDTATAERVYDTVAAAAPDVAARLGTKDSFVQALRAADAEAWTRNTMLGRIVASRADELSGLNPVFTRRDPVSPLRPTDEHKTKITRPAIERLEEENRVEREVLGTFLDKAEEIAADNLREGNALRLGEEAAVASTQPMMAAGGSFDASGLMSIIQSRGGSAEHMSPRHAMERVNAWLKTPEARQLVADRAAGSGLDPYEYLHGVVKPAMMHSLYEAMARQETPQNGLAWFAAQAFDNSLIIRGLNLGINDPSTNRLRQDVLSRHDGGFLFDASTFLAGGMIDSPLFLGTSLIGGAAAKATVGKVAERALFRRMVASETAKRGALTAAERTALQSASRLAGSNMATQGYMGTAFKYGMQMAREGFTFASFEGLSSSLSQLSYEGDWHAGETGKAMGKGLVLGGVLGAVGTKMGQYQRYMAEKAAPHMRRALHNGRAGNALANTLSYGGSLSARVGVFTASDIAMEKLTTGHVDWDDVDEKMMQNTAMLMGFDAMHVVQQGMGGDISAARDFLHVAKHPKLRFTREELDDFRLAGFEFKNEGDLMTQLLRRVSLEKDGATLGKLLADTGITTETYNKVMHRLFGGEVKMPHTMNTFVSEERGRWCVSEEFAPGYVNRRVYFGTRAAAEAHKARVDAEGAVARAVQHVMDGMDAVRAAELMGYAPELVRAMNPGLTEDNPAFAKKVAECVSLLLRSNGGEELNHGEAKKLRKLLDAADPKRMEDLKRLDTGRRVAEVCEEYGLEPKELTEALEKADLTKVRPAVRLAVEELHSRLMEESGLGERFLLNEGGRRLQMTKDYANWWREALDARDRQERPSLFSRLFGRGRKPEVERTNPEADENVGEAEGERTRAERPSLFSRLFGRGRKQEVENTDAPVERTDAPVERTEAPVERTEAPMEYTAELPPNRETLRSYLEADGQGDLLRHIDRLFEQYEDLSEMPPEVTRAVENAPEPLREQLRAYAEAVLREKTAPGDPALAEGERGAGVVEPLAENPATAGEKPLERADGARVEQPVEAPQIDTPVAEVTTSSTEAGPRAGRVLDSGLALDGAGRPVVTAETTAEQLAGYFSEKLGHGLDRAEANGFIDAYIAESMERKRALEEQGAPRPADFGTDAEAYQRAKEEYQRAKTEADHTARVWQEAREQFNRGEGNALTVEGVPDVTNDTPDQARARGYVLVNGDRMERPAAVRPALEGAETTVVFSNGADGHAPGRYVILPIEQTYGSHINGMPVVEHFFISRGQPKRRTGADSVLAENSIATKPDERLLIGSTAYEGAPVVNARGEVVQGNNRWAGMKKMTPEAYKEYRRQLADHAEEFGMTREQVERLPDGHGLFRRVDVDDATAIYLGSKTRNDIETGGVQHIEPVNAATQLTQKGLDGRVSQRLFLSQDPEATLGDMVNENAGDVLALLHTNGCISDTQFTSAFGRDGRVTKEAKAALKELARQLALGEASERTRAAFEDLPEAKQDMVVTMLGADSNAPEGARLRADLREALALVGLVRENGTDGAKTVEEYRAAIRRATLQGQFFDTSRTKAGEAAAELAARLLSQSGAKTKEQLRDYYEKVREKEPDLFDPQKTYTREEALEAVFGIKLQGPERKPVETRPAETGAKPAEAKPTEAKPTEAKPTEAAPAPASASAEEAAADTPATEKPAEGGYKPAPLSKKQDKSTAKAEYGADRKEDLTRREKGTTSSLDELQELFLATCENGYERDVMARVMQLARRLGVQVETRTAARKRDAVAATVTVAQGDKIGMTVVLYKTRLADKKVSNGEKATDILHELIHTVTNVSMHRVLSPKSELSRASETLWQAIPAEQRAQMEQGARELKSIWDEIKDDPAFRGTYGRTSASEMASELSSPAFRTLLKAKGLWRRFVGGLAKILGFEQAGYKETDALTEAEYALAKILDAWEHTPQSAIDGGVIHPVGEGTPKEVSKADKSRSGEEPTGEIMLEKRLEDPELIDRFNREDQWVEAYRDMQVRFDANGEMMRDADGNILLWPPMDGMTRGRDGKFTWREPVRVGDYDMAESDPSRIKFVQSGGVWKAKTDLKGNTRNATQGVDYNDYLHARQGMMNDQFSGAQTRPELVSVRVLIPRSELDSGFKSEYGNLAVGAHRWKGGKFEVTIPEEARDLVYLSRYQRIDRIMRPEEVADDIVKKLQRNDRDWVKSCYVKPAVRPLLEERGILVIDTDSEGKPVGEEARRLMAQKEAEDAPKIAAWRKAAADAKKAEEKKRAAREKAEAAARGMSLAQYRKEVLEPEKQRKQQEALAESEKLKAKHEKWMAERRKASEKEDATMELRKDDEGNKESTVNGEPTRVQGEASSGAVRHRPQVASAPTTQRSDVPSAKVMKKAGENVRNRIKKILNQGGDLGGGSYGEARRKIRKVLSIKPGTDSDYAHYTTPLGSATLRVSNHWAAGKNVKDNGTDQTVSIVLKHKDRGSQNRGGAAYTEITYPESVVRARRGDVVRAVLEGVKTLIETGEFVDKSGLALPPEHFTAGEFAAREGVEAVAEMSAAALPSRAERQTEAAERFLKSRGVKEPRVVDTDDFASVAEEGGKYDVVVAHEADLNRDAVKARVDEGGRVVLRSEEGDKMARLPESLRPAYAEMLMGEGWRAEPATRENIGYADAGQMVLTRAGGKRAGADPTDVLAKAEEVVVTEQSKRLDQPTGQFMDADPTTEMMRKLLGLGAAAEYDSRVSRDAHRLAEIYQNGAKSLETMQEAILDVRGEHLRAGERIPDYLNVAEHFNHQSSRVAIGQDKYNREYYDPLLSEAARLLKESGISVEQLEHYMLAKSGLERNLVMAERDAEAKLEDAFRADVERLNNLPGGQIQPGYIGSPQHRAYVKAKLLADFRSKDYGGLTGLTGKRTVGEAEQAALDLVDTFERDTADTRELWRLTKEATDRQLDIEYEAGLLDASTRDHLKSWMQYYVPMRGFEEETAADRYRYEESASRPSLRTTRHAGGRRSVADSPLATIGAMGDQAVRNAETNLTKQILLNLAMERPSDLLRATEYAVLGDDGKTWMPVFPDIDGLEPQEAQRVIRDWHEEMRAKVKDDPQHYRTMKVGGGPLLRTMKANLKEHQVMVYVGGKATVVQVNGDPMPAQLLNGTRGGGADALPGIKAVNRFYSRLYTTLSPGFVANNVIRDTHTALVNAYVQNGNAAGQLRNAFGIRGMYKKYYTGTLDMSKPEERYFAEFLENGGETGYAQSLGVEGHRRNIQRIYREATGRSLDWSRASHAERGWLTRAQEIAEGVGDKAAAYFLGTKMGRALRSPVTAGEVVVETVEEFNRSVENASRFAQYVASRKQGKSILESVTSAKEVTANFNTKGLGREALRPGDNAVLRGAAAVQSYLLNYMLFVNPAIQGIASTYGRAIKTGRAGRLALTVGLGHIAFAALQRCLAQLIADDEYDELPDYERRNNLCFPLAQDDSGKWTWLKLPLSHEARIFYGAGVTLGDMVMGKKRDMGEHALHLAESLNGLLPVDLLQGYSGAEGESLPLAVANNLIPTQVKPLTDTFIRNRSWSGRKIWDDNQYKNLRPEHERGLRTTTPWLTDLSKWAYEHTGGDEIGKHGWANLNPAKMEYLLEQYAGPAWKEPARVASLVSQLYGGFAHGEWDTDQPLRSRIPFFGGLTVQTDEHTRQMNTYRDYKREEEKMERVGSDLKSKTPLERMRYFSTPEGKRYLRYKQTERTINRLTRGKGYDNPRVRAEVDRLQKKLLDEAQNAAE